MKYDIESLKSKDRTLGTTLRYFMNISCKTSIRGIRVFFLFLMIVFAAGYLAVISYVKASAHSPASVIGVHHLGPDYLINRFYINKKIGDSVGEGGGGGSHVCCVSLANNPTPRVSVDIRWKVHHIIRSSAQDAAEAKEVEGIYQAQVPIEPYAEPGDVYVHFFPNGRVRVVVSSVTSDGENHPIRKDDVKAGLLATRGRLVDAIFSKEELVELQREIDRDRKRYGDWR